MTKFIESGGRIYYHKDERLLLSLTTMEWNILVEDYISYKEAAYGG